MADDADHAAGPANAFQYVHSVMDGAVVQSAEALVNEQGLDLHPAPLGHGGQADGQGQGHQEFLPAGEHTDASSLGLRAPVVVDLQFQPPLIALPLVVRAEQTVPPLVDLGQHPVGLPDDLIEEDGQNIALEANAAAAPDLFRHLQIVLCLQDVGIVMSLLFSQSPLLLGQALNVSLQGGGSAGKGLGFLADFPLARLELALVRFQPLGKGGLLLLQLFPGVLYRTVILVDLFAEAGPLFLCAQVLFGLGHMAVALLRQGFFQALPGQVPGFRGLAKLLLRGGGLGGQGIQLLLFPL